MTDITDQMLLEEAPISLFKLALEAAADAVVITDTKGSVVWVNPAFEVLTGYLMQDVKGQNPRLLKSGKQNSSYYKNLWETISVGQVWSGELWNKRKDGSVYLEEQSITPVKNDAGKITHFIGIKRDISKQYKLQNQLNMAQRIEAIANLTAGVAHNFNNKLASILGYAELAVEEAEQYSNEDLIDYLQEISVAGKLARDLVRQMMAFSQNDINEIQSIDLVDVIKESIKVLSSTLPSAVKIFTKLDNVPKVNVDPVRLHQMILSLVVNSSEAMDGKGVVTIGVNKQSIKDTICNSCHENIKGSFIVLYIHDTGKGIQEKDMEKLFLPFFTTRESEGGTGMGLSALHGMLHDQQGHVLVDSVAGQYTEFKLLFPEKEQVINDAQINVSDQKIKQTADREKHIMIVDDEEPVANVLSEIIRHYDYKVTVETNSKKALIKFSNNPDIYDLIITDKDMPHLTGVELASSINSINKNVPVILITGYNKDSISENADGIKMILSKPFETTELIESIRKLVD